MFYERNADSSLYLRVGIGGKHCVASSSNPTAVAAES